MQRSFADDMAVRLTDHDAAGGGRAEMFMGGEWGTICDTWFLAKYWPTVFCMQLGYTKAVESAYVSDKGYNPSKRSITFMDPKCNPTATKEMYNCPRTGKECGHNKDVYVRCSGKHYNSVNIVVLLCNNNIIDIIVFA
eukprot:GHVU01056516.1.p1 GENE.GHVU01056516.1~~GHVU01056516.1.p1  ORF type:complete len:138 (-),score=9.50 GHVU01056516.1:154-567(-)